MGSHESDETTEPPEECLDRSTRTPEGTTTATFRLKVATINRSGLGHTSPDEPRMNASQPRDEVTLDDFPRRFELRATSLMWFLGAGASASAGIPTASDLIWELKQKLFVSQQQVSCQTV